jgi:hypothetical protein
VAAADTGVVLEAIGELTDPCFWREQGRPPKVT